MWNDAPVPGVLYRRIPRRTPCASGEWDLNRRSRDRVSSPARPADSVREPASYLHCKMCLDEMPSGASPALWARLSFGVIPRGIQIWCERHDAEVARIDFERLDAWKEGLADDECVFCRCFGPPPPEN